MVAVDEQRTGAPGGAPPQSPESRTDRLATGATTLLPIPLLVYLGMKGGGYPAGITGVAATLLACLIILRAVVAPRTFRRPSGLALLAGAGLLVMAAWALLSAAWSHSAARAIAEFDRTVLYLLVLTTFATLPRVSLRPVLVSTGAGLAVLALIGLATRLRPDLFPVAPTVSPQRLSYPLGYWNALGVMTAMALVLCLHAAGDSRGRLPIRVVAAALCPPLVATLYLTLSRGGIGAAVLGVALYIVISRSRGVLLALAATVVPCYLVITHAYDATALVSVTPAGPEAVVQGHALMGTVVWCTVAAGVLGLLLVPLDGRLTRIHLPTLAPRQRLAVWGGVVVLVLAVALAAGAPSVLSRQYDRFVQNAPTSPSADPRARLSEVYNSNRLAHWQVALDASRDHRWRGVGAGTFELQWNRLRQTEMSVTEAHSLYVETLSELGVVGLGALALVLLSLVAGAATYRRRSRAEAAAVVAVTVAWAAHAALDWDWEMPVLTAVPIILCATAIASARPSPRPAGRATAIVVAVAALGLAAVPAVEALAQTRIDQALAAYDHNACSGATRRADQARALLPQRPEAAAIQALCAARAGAPQRALGFAREAVSREPGAWEWRYMSALVIGAVGGDPRPDIGAAHLRNPLAIPPLALSAVLREGGRARWADQSRQAYVWIHGRARPAIGF
jgi:hypothetical protein